MTLTIKICDKTHSTDLIIMGGLRYPDGDISWYGYANIMQFQVCNESIFAFGLCRIIVIHMGPDLVDLYLSQSDTSSHEV